MNGSAARNGLAVASGLAGAMTSTASAGAGAIAPDETGALADAMTTVSSAASAGATVTGPSAAFRIGAGSRTGSSAGIAPMAVRTEGMIPLDQGMSLRRM